MSVGLSVGWSTVTKKCVLTYLPTYTREISDDTDINNISDISDSRESSDSSDSSDQKTFFLMKLVSQPTNKNLHKKEEKKENKFRPKKVLHKFVVQKFYIVTTIENSNREQTK